jgi:CheY-like chemotaxis protein
VSVRRCSPPGPIGASAASSRIPPDAASFATTASRNTPDLHRGACAVVGARSFLRLEPICKDRLSVTIRTATGLGRVAECAEIDTAAVGLDLLKVVRGRVAGVDRRTGRDVADEATGREASRGRTVAMASDAREALSRVDACRPDVAILDIGLPVMDGYELANLLRQRAGSPITLIAVTGYGQPQDKAQADAAGFDAHFGQAGGCAAVDCGDRGAASGLCAIPGWLRTRGNANVVRQAPRGAPMQNGAKASVVSATGACTVVGVHAATVTGESASARERSRW